MKVWGCAQAEQVAAARQKWCTQQNVLSLLAD